MTHDPYTPPQAPVSDIDRSQRVRRPALIWITQGLALFVTGLGLLGAVRVIETWGSGGPGGISKEQLLVALLVQFALCTFPLALCLSLIRPQQWTRWGTMAFALLLLLLELLRRQKYRYALPVDPAELKVAAFVEIVAAVLLLLYPVLLYFSGSVRAFFNRGN